MPNTNTELTQEQILEEIKTTYFTIDENFDDNLEKCKEPNKRKKRKNLIAIRDAARDAFWKSVATTLADSNPLVVELHKDLKRTNKKINKYLSEQKDIVKIIKVMNEAVKLAGSLVTLAAV